VPRHAAILADSVTISTPRVPASRDGCGFRILVQRSRAQSARLRGRGGLLERYRVDQLIGFAKRLDPGLTDQDSAGAARQLDQVEDGWFASLRLGPWNVAMLRERFAAWPRS
jgi:hypothetical protein